MNPGFLGLGGVAALLALGCLWLWKKYRDEIALMVATQTSPAADVASLAPGTFVEVKGTIRCEAPLAGEFSQKPCVYFKAEIERKEVRRSGGKRQTHYVTEQSTERHAPFHVEDESGRVLVRGEGAEIETTLVFNEDASTGAQMVASALLTITGAGSSERRMKEHILAPDVPIYVLGTVAEDRAIAAAPKGAKVKDFIVTTQSEEERASSSRFSARVWLGVALALFAGAIASLVAAFLYPVP